MKTFIFAGLGALVVIGAIGGVAVEAVRELCRSHQPSAELGFHLEVER